MKMKLSIYQVFVKTFLLLAIFTFCMSNVRSKIIRVSDIKEKDGYLIGGGYKVKLIPEPKQFITGFSLEHDDRELLPGFQLTGKPLMGIQGMRFSFSNPSTQTSADIRLAVYPSVRKAQESALLYFNSMAAVWTPGVKNGAEIGDSRWYRELDKDSHISFLRNNVFVEVLVGGKGYSASAEVAQVIDHALFLGTGGVQLGSTPPSLIQSIELPEQMHVGEEATIRIHPRIINNRPPKYYFMEHNEFSSLHRFGEYHREKIDNGEFGYKATIIGKEKMLIYVYDEDCRVSWEVKEIEIVP